MADSASVGTGSATSTPPVTQGGGQVQPASGGDMVPVSRSDYERYIRNDQRIKGIEPFIEKGKAFGIQRPEDFDRFDPYFKTIQDLEKRGIKHDMLGRMFSPDADSDLNGDDSKQPQFDPVKFEKDMEAKWERRQAERDWEDLTKKEKDHVDAALRNALGEDKVDDMTKAMYRRAVNDYLNEIREVYPKGHPLHESHLQPIGESHAKKAVDWFKAERAKYAGSAMAAKADAALKTQTRTPTAAGSQGGQGKPKEESSRRSVKEDIDEGVSKVFAGLP